MNLNRINLRRATPEDIPQLQALYVHTIDNACTGDYDEAQRNVWKKSIENTGRWTVALQTQYFLVATIGGDIAGFGSLRDGDYIDFMYTATPYLGKGIASAIYTALEQEAIRQYKMTLTSDVSKTARRFFESKGFVIEKENEHMINGVMISNYRMRKEL
jgi:putative acetyltransferase